MANASRARAWSRDGERARPRASEKGRVREMPTTASCACAQTAIARGSSSARSCSSSQTVQVSSN
eukprot:7011998-Alexandrium_andersonii.AAC.1